MGSNPPTSTQSLYAADVVSLTINGFTGQADLAKEVQGTNDRSVGGGLQDTVQCAGGFTNFIAGSDVINSLAVQLYDFESTPILPLALTSFALLTTQTKLDLFATTY